MNPKRIAHNLRILRGNKTIAKVSEETGLKPAAISNYENGTRIPRDEVKIILAKYYNKTVDEIFFD